MRGVAFRGNSVAEVIDYPDVEPGPEQVLVKLRSSGLCGSDFNRYRADNPNEHSSVLVTSRAGKLLVLDPASAA